MGLNVIDNLDFVEDELNDLRSKKMAEKYNKIFVYLDEGLLFTSYMKHSNEILYYIYDYGFLRVWILFFGYNRKEITKLIGDIPIDLYNTRFQLLK